MIKNIHQPVWQVIQRDTLLGDLSLIASPVGLVKLSFGDSISAIETNNVSALPAFLPEALRQVMAYLGGERKIFDIPLDMSGFSSFEKTVMLTCIAIPFGQVLTYGEIAIQIGKAGAARAVGGVMARNPVPIVIPCHRVVAADHSLHGYSGFGGLATKEKLLLLEGHRVVHQRLG